MRKIIILLCLLLWVQPFTSGTYANESEAKLTFLVKASSHSLFQSVLSVNSGSLYQSLITSKPLQKVSELPHTNNYLLIEDMDEIRIFLMDEHGDVFDMLRKEKVAVPVTTAKKLYVYFKVLEGKHFGKLLDWTEVDERLPKYSTYRITDLETGLSFQAQRRAGRNHADVQPLTRKDTKIMKEIYDGEWSWKRRAIVVHVDDQKIAASMHGMPHGAGALANGFPGHFCIHFKDSVTHKTRKKDLSHQVMVYKAAGLLPEFVNQLSAQEVIELFFISLNQQDLDLLKLIYHGYDKNYSILLEDIELVRIMDKKLVPSLETDLVLEMPVTYKIKEKDKAEVEKTYVFKAQRESPTGRWVLVDVPGQ
ncbi:hypothetical protein H1D32_05045 [Anaerobacillus sp. CMMVII]|uniref:hypothetical protein n=1 Tax=Anaerobacillus sp. CMMVII TaxID=2755588 RepID=UPI0021B7855C|nr:hypothetical protein [Anaerobacillus sp. CMMVII]MCT8137161.1 hypothetical protein [Anaerobacillus sp. CMMVII]